MPCLRACTSHGAPALRGFIFTLTVAATALLVGPAVRAQTALSLEQALRAAQDRPGALAAQDAALAAAREMAVAAGQRPDPTLKLALTNLPVNGPDRFSLTRDFMTMRSVGVMQELTGADKLAARAARFERDADAGAAARALALADLRRDTALAWLDRYHQERILETLQGQHAEAGLQVEAADVAYRGGRGSQADVFAARSAAALVDDRMLLARQQVSSARIRLARWVGPLADHALATPPPLDRLGPAAQRIEPLLAGHPQALLLLRQEDTARADAQAARVEQRPDWSVELMFSQRGPAYSNMVSIEFSVPLQLDRGQRQDREHAARLARVAQAQAERELALREQAAQVRAWHAEWQGGRDRLAHYAATLAPLAGERTRAALAAYRGGAGSLSAVLEARRAEIETRVERLRLEMETADRWARLEFLVPPAAAPKEL